MNCEYRGIPSYMYVFSRRDIAVPNLFKKTTIVDELVLSRLMKRDQSCFLTNGNQSAFRPLC